MLIYCQPCTIAHATFSQLNAGLVLLATVEVINFLSNKEGRYRHPILNHRSMKTPRFSYGWLLIEINWSRSRIYRASCKWIRISLLDRSAAKPLPFTRSILSCSSRSTQVSFQLGKLVAPREHNASIAYLLNKYKVHSSFFFITSMAVNFCL